ncbi:MAG: iron-sulfur cluster-binding protein, partial [Planctomycetota bacterium]
PLGNGFTIPENKKTAYLIVGGMGAGPLLHLAKQLTAQRIDINVTAFAGAKSSLDLPFHGRVEELNQQLGYPIREFAMFAIASFVATDDGTAGFHGFVTDCFTQWLKQNKPKSAEAVIYTCGPEIMLEQVAKIAKENNIDCQVSMEGRMACGIGICQGCAIGCKTENSDETTYKMCCKDGPVFNSKEIYG